MTSEIGETISAGTAVGIGRACIFATIIGVLPISSATLDIILEVTLLLFVLDTTAEMLWFGNHAMAYDTAADVAATDAAIADVATGMTTAGKQQRGGCSQDEDSSLYLFHGCYYYFIAVVE